MGEFSFLQEGLRLFRVLEFSAGTDDFHARKLLDYLVGIAEFLGIPVKLIGVGEKIDDLQKFDPSQFITALFADFNVESEMSDAELLVEANEGIPRDDDLFDL